jgi:uncharacterized protein YjbI with pentapeptide repeats
MANPEHLAKLKEGVEAWNQWRQQNPRVEPDLNEANLIQAALSGANLRKADFGAANLGGANLIQAALGGANLSGANLSNADLTGAHLNPAYLLGANLINANLSRADLLRADLSDAALFGANLNRANLSDADLGGADLSGANLSLANFSGAYLSKANLSGADLSGANLNRATLVETNLEGANLTSCSVYGISVWDVNLKEAVQANLVITPSNQPVIQVDNLEVAQFIYLLLNNERIRHVIDTITSKVVLILGRFTPERKAILDSIREELRKHDYLPVLFDFEKPASKDLTGTVSTLANMARFIIADLTDPSSVPHELATIVPGTVVPVQAILVEGQREYAMFADVKRRYHWVLEPYQYQSKELLITHLNERVIAPAESKAKELTRK